MPAQRFKFQVQRAFCPANYVFPSPSIPETCLPSIIGKFAQSSRKIGAIGQMPIDAELRGYRRSVTPEPYFQSGFNVGKIGRMTRCRALAVIAGEMLAHSFQRAAKQTGDPLFPAAALPVLCSRACMFGRRGTTLRTTLSTGPANVTDSEHLTRKK